MRDKKKKKCYFTRKAKKKNENRETEKEGRKTARNRHTTDNGIKKFSLSNETGNESRRVVATKQMIN